MSPARLKPTLSWMYIAIPLIDLIIETSWYTFVATAMSSAAPRRVYLRAKTGIDRASGCVLGALGLRLIVEGVRDAVSRSGEVFNPHSL